MTKPQKINLILFIIISIYTLIIFILLTKQHFEIKSLENINTKNETVIENLRQDLNSSEYKAVMKCKKENRWKAECIAWELNK